jgi:HK97 family phage portal protein
MLLGPDGKPFEAKNASEVVSLDQLADISGFVRYGTQSRVTVNPTTAVQVSAVLCGVKVLSEGIAQMPVRVMTEDYDGDNVRRKIARDHWSYRLLAKRPNEFQTSFEFREYVITAALLDRGFLGIKNTLSNGKVTEILPLPMGTWSIERKTSSWEHYFRVSYANGTTGNFLPSQVVYLRGPSLDGWRALPGLGAAREAIGLSMALEKQQARLMGNGGKPSGVLSFAETLKPEQRDNLRKLWQERFGPNGEGGVAILDGAARFESMTMTSVDAQHLETRQFQIEEVARVLRVHPIMLMHSNASTTFASAEQHFRNHVVHSLGPWMRRFEEVFNRDILGNRADMRVDLDERALLRGDFKDQAEYYTKALGAGGQPGWMTPNEIRAERDMNPVDAEWANEVPRGAMNGDNADGNQGDTATDQSGQ